MSVPITQDVTNLLRELTGGNRAALDQLVPLLYEELRKLAAAYLRRENRAHTLQPTALVNEVWLRLADQSQVNWQNRAHFFGIAAQMMRRVLVDHARRQQAEKRGAGFNLIALDENPNVKIEAAAEPSLDLIALDDALRTLAQLDPQKSRVVELRYFGGLSVEETAEVLGVSEPTVKRHWRLAKAWLYGEINRK
ncbi:MAG TPA: sigma-70 family RNA polymerase sigma factor [Roseiflexaceae bacterium]|nr:sigma-70 family RNA polymerase sigma factor [Roseiflexaceae bacterium]